jgi:hypothetical protein
MSTDIRVGDWLPALREELQIDTDVVALLMADGSELYAGSQINTIGFGRERVFFCLLSGEDREQATKMLPWLMLSSDAIESARCGFALSVECHYSWLSYALFCQRLRVTSLLGLSDKSRVFAVSPLLCPLPCWRASSLGLVAKIATTSSKEEEEEEECADKSNDRLRREATVLSQLSGVPGVPTLIALANWRDSCILLI